MRPANFKQDLKFSSNHDVFWATAYSMMFDNYSYMSDTITNFAAQREGIDRVVYLTTGDVIGIEEKLQRRVWDTLLLEYISNDTKDIHDGWIEKNLKSDYLAYGFLPNTVCFVPMSDLKKLYNKNKDLWLRKYNNICARNKYYNTYSIAVPIDDVVNYIPSTRLITLTGRY